MIVIYGKVVLVVAVLQNGLIKILKITNENIGFDNVNQYSRDYMVTTYNDLKYCPFCGGKIVW